MTTPPIGETMRALMRGIGKAGALSQMDRNLAAATLVGVAVAVVWPRNKVPKVAEKVGDLGQQLWNRRDWWITDAGEQ